MERSRSTPSRLIVLPAEEPRWHNAVVQVEDALAAWSLPIHLARRWLQPARRVLAQQEAPLELFVQLEPVDGVVIIEISDERGRPVFSAGGATS